MLDTVKLKAEVESLGADTRAWHSGRDFKGMEKTEFVDAMKTKHDYLFSNSPTLFERVMQGDLNMQHLEYMLGKINQVNAGGNYHDASVEVGQKLVDIYVKPIIDKK